MDRKRIELVRDVAVTGWCTLLVALALLTLAWLVWMWLFAARPSWIPALWLGADWESMQRLTVRVVAAVKIGLWAWLLGLIWLSLWVRRARRRGQAESQGPQAARPEGR